MAKKLIKEIIILLLSSLAILLILGILLYDYIPTNKKIPEVTKYETSAELKAALADTKVEETNIILTYEITDTDLALYKNNRSYIPSKENPFAGDYTYSNATVIDYDGVSNTGAAVPNSSQTTTTTMTPSATTTTTSSGTQNSNASSNASSNN